MVSDKLVRKMKNPKLFRDMSVSVIGKVFRWLFIIGMCYVFLFPVIYITSVALRDPSSVNDPSIVWVPKQFSWQSILETIDILHYPQAVLLTMRIAVFSTLGTLFSCLMVGYSLARFRYWEKQILFGLVLLTIIVPPQTILLSSYVNFDAMHLLNKPAAFVLPSFFASGLRAGLFIFICRQFFLGMPKDLEEAAKIDGCGALRTFVQIMVPLAKPAIITVMLFSFVWHWNDFYSSAMYFHDEVRPISVMLNSISDLLKASIFTESTTAAQMRTYTQAGALLTILPPLVLYIFTQKHFTESIERTGIVG